MWADALSLFDFPPGSIRTSFIKQTFGNGWFIIGDVSHSKYWISLRNLLMSSLCMHSDQKMNCLTIQRYSLQPEFDIFLFSSEDPLDLTKWGITGYNSMYRKISCMFKCYLHPVESESKEATRVAWGCSLSHVVYTNSPRGLSPLAL